MKKGDTSTDALKDLFSSGLSSIDELDVYKTLEGSHIYYTNDLIRRTAEVESVSKTIKNMEAEIDSVLKERNTLLDNFGEFAGIC